MSEIVAAPSKTYIREELFPSKPLYELLSAFLERPSESDIRFYTQAEREVPTRDVSTQAYWRDTYKNAIQAAQTRLRHLGRSSLALAANVRAEGNETDLTLSFDVANSDKPLLNRMTGALNEIEWWGESPPGLYVQLARSGLAESAERRREAARSLTRRLRDPLAARQMRVGNVRLVSRDVPILMSFNR